MRQSYQKSVSWPNKNRQLHVLHTGGVDFVGSLLCLQENSCHEIAPFYTFHPTGNMIDGMSDSLVN